MDIQSKEFVTRLDSTSICTAVQIVCGASVGGVKGKGYERDGVILGKAGMSAVYAKRICVNRTQGISGGKGQYACIAQGPDPCQGGKALDLAGRSPTPLRRSGMGRS